MESRIRECPQDRRRGRFGEWTGATLERYSGIRVLFADSFPPFAGEEDHPRMDCEYTNKRERGREYANSRLSGLALNLSLAEIQQPQPVAAGIGKDGEAAGARYLPPGHDRAIG
jgi:hypothetical protein